MYKFTRDINVPGRVFFKNNRASIHYDRSNEAINFRIDDIPLLTLSKDGITAVGMPEPPFDVNVINSIPISVTTVQILSTEITGFDASLQDINGNLLTVLSDDYSSTTKTDLTKIAGNDVDIGNGTSGTATQRVCIASNNLPITITPSAPISTLSTVTNTVNVQTDGLTDKVQTAIDMTDITSKGQQLMADSIPVTVASDQSNILVTLDEIAGNFKSNNDSLNINIMRINDKASAFFNTGPATDGTLKVVLTNDYLSTVTNMHQFESFYYHRAAFQLNASTNMAQNLGLATNTTLPGIIGNIIYLDKISLNILFVSGTADVNGWGTGGSALASGGILEYHADSTHTAQLTGQLKTNNDIIYYFDETEYYAFGSGTSLNAVMRFPYKIKIDFTDSGLIRYAFPAVDLTDAAKVGSITSSVWYYSDTAA